MERRTLSEMQKISLNPKSTEEDVSQCMGMIFGTPKGTVPYMRGFGIEPDLIDNRITTDINEIVDESYEQVERYEPRSDLEDVEQEADVETGSVDVILKYSIEDEDEEDDEEEDDG